MAKTASTGLTYYRSLSANTAEPILKRIKIANSATLRVGDAYRVNTGGFVVTAGVGNPIGGVIVGFTDQNGIGIGGFGTTNNTGASTAGDDQITTASDNQTRANYAMAQVTVDPSGNNLYLNKADSALAQTNLLQYFDLDASSRQVTVSTASDSNGQLQLMELDPDATGGATADTTKGLFRINENQYGNAIDTGTAKVAA